MATLDALIEAWDEGHREFAIALEGLADEDLWKRPHPRLLSIGELAGHIAYYEAIRTTGPSGIQGALVDEAFKYYTSNLESPVSLGLSVEEVGKEVARVHQEAKAAVTRVERDSDDSLEGVYPEWPHATWGQNLQYRVFHVAYHTGQVYSARHLLGHTPEDN